MIPANLLEDVVINGSLHRALVNQGALNLLDVGYNLGTTLT